MGVILNSIRRSIRRNAGFLTINIIGLAIGLAVSLVLLLFIVTELSYDRHFTDFKRIVQLNTIGTENGLRTVYPINIRKAYTELPSRIPGIEKAVQIYRGFDVEIKAENSRFQNLALLYADPEVFDVFKMGFLSGNSSTALSGPNSAVITGRIAEKVFGNLDATGKSFILNEQVFNVTAVVNELPVNTHFSFDIMASMKSVSYLDQLGGLEFFTYYLLRPNVSKNLVCKQINDENSAMLREGFKGMDIKIESSTVDLKDIYLRSESDFSLGPKGSVESVLILSGLAFLILLLAITNFVNLFVVQGDARALEVGIRKTAGAGKRDIAVQFFTEAAVTVIIAFIVAAGIADILTEPFSLLTGKVVGTSLIHSPLFIAGVLILVLLTIILSAAYPAFYLSRFKPVEIFRKARKSVRRRFSTSITIFQSVITIVLISVIITINKQLRFFSEIPRGYNTENVMVIRGSDINIAAHYEALRQELEGLPKVEMVSASHHLIGGGCSGQGIRLLEDTEKGYKSINEYRVMPGLCELMQFSLVTGKYFENNNPANKSSVIINEAAARMLGIPDSAAGRKVVMFDYPMEIIGVVKDFFYDSPASVVAPVVLTSYSNSTACIYLRFNKSVTRDDAVQSVLPVFKKYDPDFVLNPSWINDIYERKFNRERSQYKIVTASTLLSLIIALLGLFSIHSYSATRRTKEIGIRKVMGEPSWSITLRLLSDVFAWIALAGALSIPVAFLIAHKWLENYANHINTGLLQLLIPVLIQLVFALSVTSVISLMTASRNPVKALRYE